MKIEQIIMQVWLQCHQFRDSKHNVNGNYKDVLNSCKCTTVRTVRDMFTSKNTKQVQKMAGVIRNRDTIKGQTL